MHIDERRAPTSGILERLPGSGIYLQCYTALMVQPLEYTKIRNAELPLNGKATYSSLYLVVWVISHYFYGTEGLPLMYKSPRSVIPVGGQ